MGLSEDTAKKLERVIREEIQSYQSYLDLIQDERKAIAKFDTEQLQVLDEQRARLTEKLKSLHESRLRILQLHDFQGESRLSAVIDRFGSQYDKRKFSPMIAQLRSLVDEARRATAEFHGVQSFALNMIHGTLSILMRATKHVSKQYGKQGKIQESYLPGSSRREGVLKEA